jgi:hypothetical protein
MTTFPRSPRVSKGAIVSIDRLNPVASVIVFQYNPDKMTRKLEGKLGRDKGDRAEVLRIQGPPGETIDMTVEIDATDQLDKADPRAVSMGIYPQLSALEMILYPKSSHVIKKTVQALAGTLEITPPEAPLTLLVWGPKRAVPVRLSGLTINETAFDPNLNPIQANVVLSLKVLTYDDFPVRHPGYALFLTHQVVMEAMASLGSLKGLGAVGGGGLKLS